MKGSRHGGQRGLIPNVIAHDTTTLALITRIAIRDNRQARGIWSRYGQAYVPHGVPDFSISQRLRSNIRGNPEEDGKGSPSDKQQTKPDSNGIANTQLKDSNPVLAIWQEHPVPKQELSRFRFPREKIHESEVRCRMGKNGKFLSSHVKTADLVFAPINLNNTNLPTQRPTEKPKQIIKQAEHRLYQERLNDLDDEDTPFSSGAYVELAKLSNSSEQNVLAHSKRTVKRKQFDDCPLSRWRTDFSTLRKKLDDKLQENLVRQQMDRSIVMHDRRLLSKLTESVERRAADRQLPQKSTVWSEVIYAQSLQQQFGQRDAEPCTLDDRKRTELYHEIQVFVQKLCAQECIDCTPGAEIGSIMDAIRKSLEERAPLNLSLLQAVNSKLSPKTQASQRYLKILDFICQYLKISQKEIQDCEEAS